MATFTNQARLTYNNIVTNSNIAAGEILEELTATKTAVDSTYLTGGDVTYVLSLVNSGTSDFTALTVSDDFGAYTVGSLTYYPLDYVDGSVRYYVNGALQSAPAVTTAPPITFSGIRVPAGGNAILVYEAAVNSYAPPSQGSTIVNTAAVTGTGITDSVTASAEIDVSSSPNLAISKSISPTTVTANSTITYTFIIQNYGNTAAEAADSVVVSDTFDPALSNISVTFDSQAWTDPENYTYDETTGLFETVEGQITVPAATYTQNANGIWEINPGSAVLVVTGTV